MSETDFQHLSSYGEADVREEIIAPVIRQLGYRTGTDNDIIRELSLTYDRISLGRQKATDPLLRGRADYILEAQKQVRWVIEAKSPSEEIGAAAVAQCWTYANHPEVRGVYFVLCNGYKWVVFQTSRGPQQTPLVEIENAGFGEIVVRLGELVNPRSLLRDFPDLPRPSGQPLGPGLRSTCRIIGGHYAIERLVMPESLPLPPGRRIPEGMVMSITEGTAERVDGKIHANYSTQAYFQQLQELNELLGLHKLTLVADVSELSTDVMSPTVFTALQKVLIPRGAKLFDFVSGQQMTVPFDMPVQTTITARGFLKDNVFAGQFESPMQMTFQGANVTIIQLGSFHLKLA